MNGYVFKQADEFAGWLYRLCAETDRLKEGLTDIRRRQSLSSPPQPSRGLQGSRPSLAMPSPRTCAAPHSQARSPPLACPPSVATQQQQKSCLRRLCSQREKECAYRSASAHERAFRQRILPWAPVNFCKRPRAQHHDCAIAASAGRLPLLTPCQPT